MNKLVIVGIILVILGAAGVGASFITAIKTESYSEMVPATRDITVQEQVPKTREVEKTKTQMVRENAPVWSDKAQQIKFSVLEKPLSTLASIAINIKTAKPMRIIVRNPIQSEINKKRYDVAITFGNYQYTGITYHYALFTYQNDARECLGCYYDTTKEREEGKWECIGEQDKYNYKDNEFIFDPERADWPQGADISKGEIKVTFFIEVYEYISNDWERVYLTGMQYNLVPYLEIYYPDHYETQNVQKLITYKETETYYVTENVTKQEEYQNEETKTREVTVRPYGLGLWVGIGLLALAVVLIALGSRKSGVERVVPAPSGKFCPKCGRENSAESVFCTNCGQRL